MTYTDLDDTERYFLCELSTRICRRSLMWMRWSRTTWQFSATVHWLRCLWLLMWIRTI